MSNLFGAGGVTQVKKKLTTTPPPAAAPTWTPPGPAAAAPAWTPTKPIPKTAPHHLRQPVKTAPVQPALTADDPPDPVISKLVGSPTSVTTFNQNLQTITDQHVKAFGYKPNPTTALHAVLTPAGTRVASTFGLGNVDPAVAQAQTALANHPPVTDAQFVKQFRQVAQGDAFGPNGMAYHQFNVDNDARIQELQGDKRWAAKIHGIVLQRSARDGAAHEANVNEATLLDPASIKHGLGLFARPITQIADSLIHAPGGFATMAENLGLDVAEIPSQAGKGLSSGFSQSGGGNATTSGAAPFHRTTGTVGQGIKQTGQDFQHPERNAGFLFLDLLGLASLGAGGAVRLAAAGRAVGALDDASLATKVSTAGRALAEKPPLQTATVRLGGYDEQMPLSQNPLVALAQKRILGARQTAADKRLAEGPSPLRSIILPQAAQDFLDEHLSFERKVGRESDARMRSEHQANMALGNELAHAAGSSLAHSQVLSRVPFVRNLIQKTGLTRGEQKAIQAASWDVDGSIFDKIQAEEDFHRNLIDMGVGSRKDHQRQIGDLALARKAVDQPSKRFVKALDLTERVVADMQRMKIEQLGLAPETAEGRIAKAAQILRGEEPVGGETVSDTSFYLPTQPRGRVKRGPSQVRGRFGVSAGPYGVSPGRPLAELQHDFTGKALTAGNYRIDATNLAGEAYARTVRAVTVKNQWKKLWDTAAETKRSEFDIPIRDANVIPDRLREVVARLDEGDFNQADAELLPADIRAITDELYPDERTLKPEEIPNVKWIDHRLLGDLEGAPSRSAKTAASVFQAINSPFRFGALYLRPAYALNKLGNHAMLAFDQGFLNSGVNMARAMSLEKTDGAADAAQWHAIAGVGKSKSYVTSASGHMSQGVAEFWARLTDRDERVASMMYYADRLGYKTPEQRHALLHDPEHSADLTQVTRRGKKALVEFDNQTPFEKNVLRHIIFVYPWVRGSAVWSLRAVMEHPAKTALLSQLGREEMTNDPLLDHAVEWYKRVGYFPVGWALDKSGAPTPKVVNPSSINTFSTIDDFLNIGKAATVGDKYASAGDLLGPAAQFAIHAATGRDEFGNQYPDGQLVGALEDTFLSLPQASVLNKGKPHPVKPFDIRDRASAVAHENSLARQAVFGPGWQGALGRWLFGGFDPRAVNQQALAAKFYNDADPATRAKHDLALYQWALTQQGEFLGTPVPPRLRSAITDQAGITAAFGKFNAANGREPTEKEKNQIRITYLTAKGRIPQDAAKKLLGQLKNLNDDDLSVFKTKLIDKYAAGKDLRQWDRDVRLLYSFKKTTFNEKTPRLFAQGLSPQRVYNVPQKTLDEYGRGYVKFEAQVRKLHTDKASAEDIRLFTDEHSKPVNGLPSYAAVAWANLSPDEQDKAVLRDAYTGWGTLTAVQKTLLGKSTDPATTEAWRAYDLLTAPAALRKAGHASLDADQRLAAVKQIDSYYKLGGKFTQDYLFAKKPLYQRLPYLDVVKDSPHRADWQQLFEKANQINTAVVNKQITSTQASDAWKDYAGQLESYYKTDNPAFWKELEPIMQANPHFLEGMIR